MNSQTIELTKPLVAPDLPHSTHHGDRRGIGRFLGHFGEMFVAMMIGMPLLGMPLAVLASALVGPSAVRIPEVRALGMTVAMTVAMVAWMRFRGHSWRASAEMAAAMIVPTLVLLPLVWLGMIPGRALMGIEHVLMVPAMLAAMLYRRSDYGL